MMKRILAGLAVTAALVAGAVAPGSPAFATGPGYAYAGGRQTSATNNITNAYSTMTVNNPWVDVTNNAHSIAEIALMRDSGGVRQMVEIGWGVNNLHNGDMATRLWAGYWVDNVWSGYNPSTFVPYCATPGTCASLNDVLVPTGPGGAWTGANGTTKQFGIHYSNNKWYVAYNGLFIGYFPDSLWSGATGGTFTGGNRIDFFGEVWSNNLVDCTDMGDAGVNPVTASAGAYFTTTTVNGSSAVLSLFNSTPYSSIMSPTTSTRSFRYGGTSC